MNNVGKYWHKGRLVVRAGATGAIATVYIQIELIALIHPSILRKSRAD